jgi:hypothetical protein
MMTRIVAFATLLAFAVPVAASACEGGFFSFTNTLCSGSLNLLVCLGDGGQFGSLRFTVRKGQSVYLQTAPSSSFSWSCNGEPAAMCPSAYCVNGSS